MKLTLIANSWISLMIAIFFGVLGTISMKLSDGLQKLKPALCLIIFYCISFVAMTYALEYIELSIVYAIWSGIGTLLVAMVSIFLFEESISVRKIIFLSLIIIGIIGIHLSDSLF